MQFIIDLGKEQAVVLWAEVPLELEGQTAWWKQP